MKILEWLLGLEPAFQRSRTAAENIADTMETIDAKLRSAAGLPPRSDLTMLPAPAQVEVTVEPKTAKRK